MYEEKYVGGKNYKDKNFVNRDILKYFSMKGILILQADIKAYAYCILQTNSDLNKIIVAIGQ